MTNLPMDQVTQARTIIEQAQDMLIVLPKSPNLDRVAAALSFYLALSSKGKRVSIACPQAMTVQFNRLIGVDKIGTNISSGNGKNLVISFPYQEGSIEKVSYNIENNTFNLVIEPREGYPTITQEMMHYSFSGGNTDVIITIGVSTLNSLNSLYDNNQDLFNGKSLINIDADPNNQFFGKINFVDPNSSSISEIIISLFTQLNLSMDSDTATNLYAGIMDGSMNFTSPNTNAATFEAAAICMRNSARKMSEAVISSPQAAQPLSGFNKPQPQPKPYQPRPQQYQPRPFQQPMRNQSQIRSPQQPAQRFQPQQQPNFQQQSQRSGIQSQQPVQNYQQPQQPINNQPQTTKQQEETPPDWLKPKIYKGSTLL